jgi:zinc D-Ala-D-Ala carboxypeptidase
MNLTPHFTLEEMQNSATATRLGIKNVIPPALIENAKRVAEALEIIRSHYGQSIHVTSCYRSPELNKAVGGSTSSSHMTASAADFEVKGHANIDVCNEIQSFITDFDQIIYEFGPTG